MLRCSQLDNKQHVCHRLSFNRLEIYLIMQFQEQFRVTAKVGESLRNNNTSTEMVTTMLEGVLGTKIDGIILLMTELEGPTLANGIFRADTQEYMANIEKHIENGDITLTVNINTLEENSYDEEPNLPQQ